MSRESLGGVPVQLTTKRTSPAARSGFPAAQGLYSPENEHDACGVSFVAQIDGTRSHRLVQQAIGSLCNLEHRGATGAEVNTGDGAGILIQIPDRFLREVVDFELPPEGAYAVGLAFLPSSTADTDDAADAVGKIVDSEGLTVLGWRDVPTDPLGADIGYSALGVMPTFRQVFISSPEGLTGIDWTVASVALQRRARAGRRGRRSARVLPVVVGADARLQGHADDAQLALFFPDLQDERVESAIGLVHSRFSTNTFPSWPLAHLYRFVAHNGEINTVQGNQNWMRAREAMVQSPHFGEGDISRVFPICTPGASDTARFDEALELLHLGGYDLPHAVLMMIPEAWENHADADAGAQGVLPLPLLPHGTVGRPGLGRVHRRHLVGAVLDRNGLRPSRYW